MSVKHIIIEGLPATGKSEVSNFLKIYFPENFFYFPELTTEIVRKHKLNILVDRNKLTDSLAEEICIRQKDIENKKNEFNSKGIKNAVILEESHIGVHWSYSKHLKDEYFLNNYPEIKKKLVFPDFFIRLMIPFELSYKRQIARNTPDVEVSTDIIRQMYEYLVEWHKANHDKKVHVIDADKSPDKVIKKVMKTLDLKYE
ncbi:deoxynucleoside kinase [Candidatus Dependentiae bacterium]|nr:deoxynucleoside kinase [Candidatus Dependentiae bacterium]